MNLPCATHGLAPHSEPTEKPGARPWCLPCLARSIAKSPQSFLLTLSFYLRLRPYLPNGCHVAGLVVRSDEAKRTR